METPSLTSPYPVPPFMHRVIIRLSNKILQRKYPHAMRVHFAYILYLFLKDTCGCLLGFEPALRFGTDNEWISRLRTYGTYRRFMLSYEYTFDNGIIYTRLLESVADFQSLELAYILERLLENWLDNDYGFKYHLNDNGRAHLYQHKTT